MSWEHSGKVPFDEVSAYFSEEEWKFLHEWQRELYRNVMKEVHQALISLGPLIATTVCSIRAKEQEEMWHPGNLDYERRHKVNHSPRFSFINSDVCARKEEPAPVVIDNPVVGVEDSISNHNSELEVVSFYIKDENEPYYMAPQTRKRTESLISPPGDGVMNKKFNCVKHNGKEIQCGAPLEQDKLKMLLTSGQGENYESHLWSTIHQELEVHENPQCDSGPSQLTHLHHETVNAGKIEKHTNWDSNVRQSAKPINKNDSIMGHKRNYRGERHYQCMVCKKSFSKRGNLVVHTRTHTGEKPFQCSECRKCFSQKEHLVSHKRTHTGERPFKCAACGKSFTRKIRLTLHERTHMGRGQISTNQCI